MSIQTAQDAALAPNHRRFVTEYLADFNALAAASRAGISLHKFNRPQGAYVYFLSDPRDGSIFYVGKGRRYRALQHLRANASNNHRNVPKEEAVAAIRAAGLEPDVLVLADGLEDGEAFRIEGALIRALSDHLSNIAQGVMLNADRQVFDARQRLLRLKPFTQWLRETNPTYDEAFLWPTVVAGMIELAKLTAEQARAVHQHLETHLARMLPPTVLGGVFAGGARG